MYLGVPTWVFSWGAPYDDAIRRIARLGGFKSVELTVWNEELLNGYYTPSTNRQLRQLIADEGLKLSELFCIPLGMASEDAKQRAASVEYLKRVLDVAHQLGADTVLTVTSCPFELDFPFEQLKPTSQEWTIELPKGLDWKRNWSDFVDTMHQYEVLLEDANMRMAIEPHPNRMIHNSAGMLRLMDQLSTNRIGLNLDPSHLFPMGEMAQVVAYEVGDRIFHTHFSDNDGQSNAHWRPGKGKIDWGATIRALDDIGYNGPLSLELEDVPGAAGYPGFNRSPHSQPELLEREYRLARDYIIRAAEEQGVQIEQ
ncbi:Sugar phosphate isomerase/epimerase [Paenibacillaceae bacterium GAS479]|nr:Sugar phosphate isomerase/epimerase [Paenibacillaceae bacterium GAS479]